MNVKRVRNRALIAAWLKREGFSLNQLTAKCGLPRQTMQAIKAGRDVRLSTIVRILNGARALARRRVVVEELFDFDGNHSKDSPGAHA